MSTKTGAIPLSPGDVVVELRGAWYGSAFGVVERVSKARAYVTFDEGTVRNTFYLADGRSCNPFRRRHGWRIVPLDAAARLDVLKTGLAHGPCSRRDLERMEAQARRLREYVTREKQT